MRKLLLVAVAAVALALPVQLGTTALTPAPLVVIAAIGATRLNQRTC